MYPGAGPLHRLARRARRRDRPGSSGSTRSRRTTSATTTSSCRRSSAGDTVIGAGKAGRVIAWQREHARAAVGDAGRDRHRNDTGPLPRRRSPCARGCSAGVETPMAYADGRVFVPVVDLCFDESAFGSSGIAFYAHRLLEGQRRARGARRRNRLAVAGTERFPSPNFGCATVVGDVVFTATYDGEVYGLSTRDGSTRAPRAGARRDQRLPGGRRPHAARRRRHRPSRLSRQPVFELIAYALPAR